jgi:beta-glucosidase-like glycosyl hydrolase
MDCGVSSSRVCQGKQINSELIYPDERMHLAPGAPIGVMHDWYPTNKSQYNDMQSLNTKKAQVDIPILQTGECLHGVGSFKQSIFPQSIGMSASFDTNLVYRVGRAIGEEASSIGIHACFAPVLDLGKDPRWGRAQGKISLSINSDPEGSADLVIRGLGRGHGPDISHGSCLCLWALEE